MRSTRWVFGVVVVLAGAFGLVAAEDEVYDLRGPAPTKGQVLVTKSTFKITDGDLVIKVAGQKLEAKQTLTSSDEEEVKVLTVDGRQVTKAQARVIKEKVDTDTRGLGDDKKESKRGDLEGAVIVSERSKDGKWKHTLVDDKPNDKQQKQLDKRVGPENQDDLYPEGKVKVGHTWTVDATALQRVFGGSITNLKGKMKMKFVKLEDVDGEACAVIEAEGKITGVAKEDEGDLEVELELKGTTWRSIKTGVDVKDKAEGKIRMSGSVEASGVKADIVITGPVTITSSSALKGGKPK